MRSFLKFVVCLAIASSIMLSALGQSDSAKETALKLQAGTYYWIGSAWSPMQQITMSGGGMKHAAKMLVPGLTPQVVWTFRDSTAPVKVTTLDRSFASSFSLRWPAHPTHRLGATLFSFGSIRRKITASSKRTNGGNMFTFKSGAQQRPDAGHRHHRGRFEHFPGVAARGSRGWRISALATSSMGVSGYDFGFHPR